MDYVALNHKAPAHGVFYNNQTDIAAGVHYYTPKKKKVTVKHRFGMTKVVVELDEQIQEIERIDSNKIEKYGIDEYHKKHAKELKRELAERAMKQAQLASKAADYSIHINGKEVNLTEEGIKRARISKKDRRWLAKAQYYFLNAKQNGRAIGSAKEYTSPEVLVALWSTAESIGVDPKRFLVQIYNESRFDPHAKGKAGERGIGQFKKATAKFYGFDWDKMTDGIDGFAHQAKAAAELVKLVGEVKYNGGGKQALKYQKLISNRIDSIDK